MLTEIQFSASDFLTQVKSNLSNAAICLSKQALPLPGPDPLYLDHLELGVPQFGGPARFSRGVTFVIASQAALEAAGPAPAAAYRRETGTMLFDLAIDTGQTGTFFRTSFADEEGGPDATMRGVLKSLLATSPDTTRRRQLSATALATALGLPPTGFRAGVARENSGAAVSIRVDFAIPPNEAAWTAFRLGSFPVRINPAGGENFAIFMDTEVITTPIVTGLAKAFTGETRLEATLIPMWARAIGGADVSLSFRVREVDACSLAPLGHHI